MSIRIRRASVRRQLGMPNGGGESAIYITSGAADLDYDHWIINADDYVVIDELGVEMVQDETGITVMPVDAVGASTRVRTVVIGPQVMVY